MDIVQRAGMVVVAALSCGALGLVIGFFGMKIDERIQRYRRKP